MAIMEEYSSNDSMKGNLSLDHEIPRDLFFNDDSLVSVIAYGVMFCIGGCANLTVFITLFRNRHRKSRVNLFIMHLSVADMIVIFIMIPMEIGWHITVSWKAGDIACRSLMFFRTFGFYLSSFILIAISIDRYFAIKHPLSINDADRRSRLMLIMAWLFSAVASLPQSVIFHVEVHPGFMWFEQCVTFNFFPTQAHELAYNLFNMAALYWAPLLVIIVSYSMILWEISKKSREGKGVMKGTEGRRLHRQETMRRSGIGRIENARIRTLKMTIIIVLVFVMTWTPYFAINAWFWIDKESAMMINSKVTRGLLIFAVSNSCVNPIIYGMFTHTFVKEWKRGCLYSMISGIQCPKLSESTTSKSYLEKNVPKESEDKAINCNQRHIEDVPLPVSAQIEDALSSESSGKYHITRQITPPHIAQGMGMRKNFEKYLLI